MADELNNIHYIIKQRRHKKHSIVVILEREGIGIQNIALLRMKNYYFGISLVKATFFLPVIGRVFRERIAAFFKIVKVSNLYFYFLYPQNPKFFGGSVFNLRIKSFSGFYLTLGLLIVVKLLKTLLQS